jgi:hypothetical protein
MTGEAPECLNPETRQEKSTFLPQLQPVWSFYCCQNIIAASVMEAVSQPAGRDCTRYILTARLSRRAGFENREGGPFEDAHARY